MTISEYEKIQNKIKTLNRKIGQLYRHLIWNYEQVVRLEAERDGLENEIRFCAAEIAEQRKFQQALWA